MATPSRGDGGGTWRGSSSRGSRRIGAAAGPGPVLRSLPQELAERERRAPSVGATPSTRGSAIWKCSPSIVSPRPGTSAGSDDAAWRETSESIASCSLQLEPRAEIVEQRRPDLRPAVGGDDDVDAEAQAGRGELLDLAVQPLELALERLPAVDQQEDVRERARVAGGGHRLVAGFAERLLAVLDLGPQLPHHARDRLALELAGDAADVRAAGQSVRAARRRGRSRRAAPAPGVWRQISAAASVRSTVLLPVRGEPTTARWPPEPARSSANGSVRCSAGRSSRPSDGAQALGALAAAPPRRRR